MLPQESFSFLCVSKSIFGAFWKHLLGLFHVHDSTAKNIHLHCFKSWQNVGGGADVLNWGGGGGVGKCLPPSPPGSYASAVTIWLIGNACMSPLTYIGYKIIGYIGIMKINDRDKSL